MIFLFFSFDSLILFGLVLWGGGGQKVLAAYNSKLLNDIEMKFGGVVENHNLTNLV